MSNANALSPLSNQAFVIQIVGGAGKGKSFKVFPPNVTIGRGDNVDIQIMDKRVSRLHCQIVFDINGIYLEHKADKSSTMINGKIIKRAYLNANAVITIGDSNLKFLVLNPQANSLAKSQNPHVIAGKTAAPNTNQQQKRNPLFYFAVVVIFLLIALVLMDETKKKEDPKLRSQADVEQEIENSVQRKEALYERRSQISQSEREDRKESQKHFIRGFRDYQNAQYSRSLEAFRTALSINPRHEMSKRYKTLALKKRLQKIDAQMNLGEKYKNKNMYNRCEAAFESVLYIINNRKAKKYQLAREKMIECRELKKKEFF